MIDLLIFGLILVTLTSLTVAFISVRFIIKHFTLTIEYLNDKEIDPYEQDE